MTHFLTGACIGRAGLNRKTAYATLVAVLAAEAADIDILWGWMGPAEELRHHRGITHTFLGAPFVAAAVVGCVWLFDRWWQARRRGKEHAAEAARTAGAGREARLAPLRQAVHWGWLYATALIAALSHLLLDWTNNYGIRPFYPFNARWYAGSLVFIFEPVLWALFALALVMPRVFGLADREIGVRRQSFRGRGWAIFALAGMVLLWGWRWMEQQQARDLLNSTQVATEPVTRMALEPYPVNPFHWHAILETRDYYQTAEVNTRTGTIDSDPHRDVLYKPTDTPAVEAAKRTLLGRVYMDWGKWAVVRDVGPEPMPGVQPPDLPPGRHWTTVEFIDLRFDYSFLATRNPGAHPPLSGWVYIVDNRDEAGAGMGMKPQR